MIYIIVIQWTCFLLLDSGQDRIWKICWTGPAGPDQKRTLKSHIRLRLLFRKPFIQLFHRCLKQNFTGIIIVEFWENLTFPDGDKFNFVSLFSKICIPYLHSLHLDILKQVYLKKAVLFRCPPKTFLNSALLQT